ncbi:hypothetical protein GCM10010219_47940 [Streptomyces netropsis]|nr:hypothetical protein GCM10010219_47940 [Streptomyces netropsis]
MTDTGPPPPTDGGGGPVPFRHVPPILSGTSHQTLTHPTESTLYFTDRGIEELENRRGEEEVSLGWVAERLREFVDLNPDFEVPVERLATWLARLDDEDDE